MARISPSGSQAGSIAASIISRSGLITLTPEQLEMVNKAKTYAMEQSIKSVLTKQNVVNHQQHQRNLQRYQALVLMCRVYVGSISFELREESIRQAFQPFGPIKSINMSWDATTQKHKGFAFVEYELPEAAELALTHMNGLLLGNRNIKVGRPSNMPQALPIIQQITEEAKNQTRIYVTSIHIELSESDVKTVFEAFGITKSCKLAPCTTTGRHKGYGYIDYDTEEAALQAVTAMNNFDLGGQLLRVCRATTPAETLNSSLLMINPAQPGTPTSAASLTSPLPATNRALSLTPSQQNAPSVTAVATDNSGQIITHSNDTNSLPNNDIIGVTFDVNNHSSNELSRVCVIRNIISENDIDSELDMELLEEFEKCGPVKKVVIFIEKSQDSIVKIFVEFKDSADAARSRDAFHHRAFNGRTLTAELYDQESYESKDYSH